MAQFGAGRGKLPQAILYPWFPAHNRAPRDCVNFWSRQFPIPAHNLQTWHCLNVNVKSLLMPIDMFFQRPCLLFHPNLSGQTLELHCCNDTFPVRVYPIPTYQGESYHSKKSTRPQYLSGADRCLETNMGQGHPLSCDRNPDGLVEAAALPHFCLLISPSTLFCTPACFSAWQPGASGVLPCSGHCSTLAFLLTSCHQAPTEVHCRDRAPY